jgi:3-phosphoshikimate 1-carboxyvinyltransferase
MERAVRRPAQLRGTLCVPGDKSVSHRAALLGALGSGTSRARGFLAADDCRATLDCLRSLGVEWRLTEDAPGVATLEIDGVGLHGLREPDDVLDAQNSGTTMRVLSGVLAGQPFTSVITGDASLRQRPMDRIIQPLREMGAQLLGRAGDRLPPLTIRGGALRGIRYRLPVDSAQVKSCVLLAGLYAQGETVVEEPVTSRDHTERLLHAMGADLRREGPAIRIAPTERLAPFDIEVPGDLSSAAFWLVLGAVHPDADLYLAGVGVNPTRRGILDALEAMGASLDVGEERMSGEEPVADIRVQSSRLRGIEIEGDPRIRDELPVLAVAAAFAEGRTIVHGAAELRVKEGDRIATLARQLRRLGVEIEEQPDGFAIDGGRSLHGAHVSGQGDHRLAMSLAVAGLVADGDTLIEDGESVSISYPGFWGDLERIGAGGSGSSAARG